MHLLASPRHRLDEFLQNLVNCINEKQPNDILIIGSDTNSSLGINYENRTGYVFSREIRFTTSQQCWNKVLSIFGNQQSSCLQYLFPKDELHHLETPLLKATKLIIIITQKADFCRVVDVFVSKTLLDSDHLAVQMKLLIVNCLQKIQKKADTQM